MTLTDLIIDYILEKIDFGGKPTTIMWLLKRLRVPAELDIVEKIEKVLMPQGVFFHAGDDRIYFQSSKLALFARRMKGHKSGYTTDWVEARMAGTTGRKRRLPFINFIGEYDQRYAYGLPMQLMSEIFRVAYDYETRPSARLNLPTPKAFLSDVLYKIPNFSDSLDVISLLKEWRNVGKPYRKTFEARALEHFGLRYNPALDAVMFYPPHLLEEMNKKGLWVGYDAGVVKKLLLAIDGVEWVAKTAGIKQLRIVNGKPTKSGFAEERHVHMGRIPWTVINAAAGDPGGEIERECYGGWDARPEMGGEETGAPDFVPLPAGAGIDYYDDGL